MKAPLRRMRPPRTVTKSLAGGAHAPSSSPSHALAIILASGLAAVAAGTVSCIDRKNEEESSRSSLSPNAVAEGRAVAPRAAAPKMGVQATIGSSSGIATTASCNCNSSSLSLQAPLHSNPIMLATSASTSQLLATSDASAERSASLAAAARLSGGGKPSPFSASDRTSDDANQKSIMDELQKSMNSSYSKVKIDTNLSGDSNGKGNNTEDNNQPYPSTPSLPQDIHMEDDSYPTFTPYHHSLLKKYLTPQIWSKLSTLQTSHGTTIEDIIRAGLALPIGANPPRRVGVLVGDAECYAVFRELLDPIISEYHGIENYEEWADPELPMESHFMNKASSASNSAASGSGGIAVPAVAKNDDDHDYGVIKSSGADEDSDENDDSSFLLDEEDDVFVEYVSLPSLSSSTHHAQGASASSPTNNSQQSTASPSSSSPTAAAARHVATIASKRKGQLRRHPTIINNPRLVTNREADPEGKYIVSTRIRVARSLEGVKFPTTMSRSERRRVQRLVGECTEHFEGANNLAHGTYLPVLGMTNDQNLDLIERHILFDNPNEWTIASGLGRDWPDGRALYANVADLQSSTPDFMIWVNEEDHLRIMCLRTGGDIQGVFTTLMNGVRELELELRKRGWHFAYDPRLGYLTSCPTNVGTTMRASVHVRLTNLGRLPDFFRLVERLKLEARGKYGETDRHYTGVFDISNAERLGKSEVHLINVMVEGVAKLIELERRLEAGETVDIDEIV